MSMMLQTAPAPVSEPLADEPGQTAAAAAPRSDEVDRMISEAAYYLAEHRGFEPGHEIDDWLQAEAQVNDLLADRAR